MPTTAPAARNSTAQRRRKTASARRDDEAPIIPILARKVREVEAKAQRGKLGPTNRVKFQVIAFLVREERARVKADTDPDGCHPRRAAEAARRRGDHPRQDRRARHLAHPAARGRPGRVAGRPSHAPRLAARVGRRARARRADHHRRRPRRDDRRARGARRAPGRAADDRVAPAREPVPAARPEPARAQGDAPPAPRRLGAHGPALQGVRDRRRRRERLDGPAARSPSSTASRPRGSR